MDAAKPLTTIDPNDPRLRQLRDVLARVQARFRLIEAVRLVPIAATLGVGAALALAVVWRFEKMLPLAGLLVSGAALVASALLTVLLYAMLRRRDLMHTALRADRALSLDERLSTALEDATRPARAGMQTLRDAQLDDALTTAKRIVPGKDLPLRVRRQQVVPLVALLALFAFTIIAPNPAIFTRDPEVQAQIEAEKARLEEVQKAIEASPNAATPELQELLKELAALQDELSREDLTKEEAVARLSEAESKLQQALDPQSPAQRAALDQLARQLEASGSDAARKAAEALRRGDTEEAAKQLEQAGRDAAEMTPEERKQLAEAMRQAGASVAPLDPELTRRLNEAANALDANDPQAAEEAMKNVGQQVRERGQQLATQKQIEHALSQLQQSKSNVARSGQQTPSGTPRPGSTTQAGGTAQANGTAMSGTPLAMNGSPVSGTPGTPNGTAVALGSRVAGTPAGTGTPGTPVLALTTPGQGTPVVVPGQGQGNQPGNQGQQGRGQGQGQNQAGQSGNQPGDGQPSGGWGKGHEEPVYAPSEDVNAALTPVTLQGQEDPNGEQSTGSTNTDANNTGPSQVPYQQVYGQYREQAGNALNSDYIPQGYKDLVRDYFDGIDPAQSQP
ncbi:MAG TPA: hypothetical protein VGE04_14265 [Chloroflexia bacterium]